MAYLSLGRFLCVLMLLEMIDSFSLTQNVNGCIKSSSSFSFHLHNQLYKNLPQRLRLRQGGGGGGQRGQQQPLYASGGSGSGSGVYLERMVERKKVYVDNLLRKHQSPDDALVMRMTYMNSRCDYNLTNALKKKGDNGDDDDDDDDKKLRKMSLIVDLKRKSPTIPHQRNIVDFSSAPKFAELLTMANTDAFLINTNDVEYGGSLNDLQECSKAVKLIKPSTACIAKDLIIHPIQIAQALEMGASGVLLIAAVVGADLEILLNAATIMGTECIVEVHTPNELDFALSKGATIFLINRWDRTTGEFFPDQAKGLASKLPMNTIALAAGNIQTIEEVAELGFYGYDGVVLGRGLRGGDGQNSNFDIKDFISQVHNIRAPPRGFLGMG